MGIYNFKIIQTQDYQGFSVAAFQETLKLTKGSRQKLLVLPTGNTPTGFYQQFTDYLLKNSKVSKFTKLNSLYFLEKLIIISLFIKFV